MDDSFKYTVNTAVMVDGGFYRKRAHYLWKDKSPTDRADELYNYCMSLLRTNYNVEFRRLYRILYYDCPPINKKVYHPFLGRTIDLGKSDEYKWTSEFFEALRCKRKMALRLGRLSENTAHYNIKNDVLKNLLKGSVNISDLSESDFYFAVEQKGVDMRIGVDIISMAMKKQVQQIILISGDSDFVPAAKQARREGIDFILAPMGAVVKPDLNEHIDGMISISSV